MRAANAAIRAGGDVVAAVSALGFGEADARKVLESTELATALFASLPAFLTSIGDIVHGARGGERRFVELGAGLPVALIVGTTFKARRSGLKDHRWAARGSPRDLEGRVYVLHAAVLAMRGLPYRSRRRSRSGIAGAVLADKSFRSYADRGAFVHFLLDTNIVIPAEPTSSEDVEPTTSSIVLLLGTLAEGGHRAVVHPASIDEIRVARIRDVVVLGQSLTSARAPSQLDVVSKRLPPMPTPSSPRTGACGSSRAAYTGSCAPYFRSRSGAAASMSSSGDDVLSGCTRAQAPMTRQGRTTTTLPG